MGAPETTFGVRIEQAPHFVEMRAAYRMTALWIANQLDPRSTVAAVARGRDLAVGVAGAVDRQRRTY